MQLIKTDHLHEHLREKKRQHISHIKKSTKQITQRDFKQQGYVISILYIYILFC